MVTVFLVSCGPSIRSDFFRNCAILSVEGSTSRGVTGSRGGRGSRGVTGSRGGTGSSRGETGMSLKPALLGTSLGTGIGSLGAGSGSLEPPDKESLELDSSEGGTGPWTLLLWSALEPDLDR